MLAGFINRQSPVTGQLVLAGNLVTLQNHTVQGQNAVALIAGLTAHLDAGQLAKLFEPMAYQGVSQALIDRLLASLDDK